MNFIDTPEFAEQRRAFLRHTGLSLAALGASGPLQVLAQNNSTLTTYHDTKNDYKIALIEPGVVTAQKLFADQASTEKLITWAYRIGGFLLLLLGFILIMGPLTMLVAFLPFLESLVGVGTFLVALGLSIPITLVTIAVAWLASRPLIGGGLLIAAAAAVWAIRNVAVKKKAATAGA